MLTTERKAIILERLARDGKVVAKELAREMGLPEDTLRRDLRGLAADGLLQRVHGGALPASPDLPDFSTRKAIGVGEKGGLGGFAAGLVEPNMTIFIDGGTTNEALVAALPRQHAFAVITHSPTIAALLEHHPTAEVTLIGGRLYKHSMVAVGAMAAAAIDALRPDLFFLGVTGVHAQAGFSTGDPEEAAIKRLIASQSRRTVVLATHDKLGAVSPAIVLKPAEATLIVPKGTPREITAPLLEAGMEVVAAG